MGISFKFRMKVNRPDASGGQVPVTPLEGPPSLASKLLPRTYLQWREPREVRLERASAQGAGRRRLMVLAFAASITFVGMMGMKVPEAMPRMLAALGIVFGMLLLIFWAYKRMPMWIWLTDTYIGHDITHNKPSRTYYKDIDRCEIAGDGAETYPMLVIHTLRGGQIAYGIEPSVEIAKLKGLLESLGVRVEVTRMQLQEL